MSTAENLSKNNFTMRAFASCLVSRSLKLLRTKILDNSTLFDIGTGDGSTTIYSFIGNSGIKFSKIIGSDINPEFVQFANRKFGDAVTTFEVYDAAGEIPETIKSSVPFDVVSSFHCLHWMKFEDIKKSILNVKTLLKPNGYFYFFFPLNLSPSKMKEKLLQRYPPGTFDLTPVFQFYKTVMKDQNFPDELREFLKTEGFELELFEVPALQLVYDLEEIRGKKSKRHKF